MHRASIWQGVIAKAVQSRVAAPDAAANQLQVAHKKLRDRFLQIAMPDFGRMPFAMQRPANHFRERGRAMAPAGASQGNCEITLTLPNVMRDQIRQQALDATEKFSRLRERTNVSRDPRIFAAEWPEARDEMRIRQKPHVENQIRIGRNAVAESEAYNRYQQRSEEHT